MNLREVVSFQGDNSTLNLISTTFEPLLLPQQKDADSESGYFLWCGAAFVTIALTFFAVVSLALWLQFCTFNPKWIALNHILHSVWLSQTFIITRCAIAMACLTTLKVNSVTLGAFKSILFFNKVVRATNALADFIQPFVDFHHLNILSMGLSWIVIIITDIYDLVTIEGKLQQTCFTKNMDQIIYCSSGTLYIGRLSRALFSNFVVQSLCILFIAIIARQRNSNQNEYEISLLLHSSAIIYSQINHSDGNVCLDPVTAAICGLFYNCKQKILLSVTD
ncbi:hypothetical protein THRCLA_03426 [Thraustotheca clavata]|uniref:Transmembrane protein n=1 Tax=Thraustotheca clavata TaxID=74557 RepID=A0A1W0A218_9STRA|nr:hypothetical protein THRCLA_03426 [Thraustotheca clavata]